MSLSDSFRSRLSPLPRPRPYHMTDLFFENGLWKFWLTTDEALVEMVYHLPCVIPPGFTPFGRRINSRTVIQIDPRYDAKEAWRWVQETLEAESRRVELRSDWEDALTGALHEVEPYDEADEED